MRIQNNIMAMNAYRNYTTNTNALSKNLEKLSSGYKINRAGDDAAGLAISEKMRAQITGLDKAQDNAQDGISLVQTAEGALTEVHDMLNRMYELAEQSANGTYDDTDRTQLQKEVNDLRTEIDRISESANFNKINLLDGSRDGGRTYAFSGAASGTDAAVDLTIKVGQYTGTDGQKKNLTISLAAGSATAATVSSTGAITITVNETKGATASEILAALKDAEMSAVTDAELKASITTALAGATASGVGVTGDTAATGLAVTTATAAGTGTALTLQIGDTADSFNQLEVSIAKCDATAMKIDGIDISTQDGAQAAMKDIENAINYISDVRGTLGATQNRLEHTINNLSVMEENIQNAESSIRDTDVAEEMMSYTKNNILIQSAQAMLAQANQVPQGVLQLLQ